MYPLWGDKHDRGGMPSPILRFKGHCIGPKGQNMDFLDFLLKIIYINRFYI